MLSLTRGHAPPWLLRLVDRARVLALPCTVLAHGQVPALEQVMARCASIPVAVGRQAYASRGAGSVEALGARTECAFCCGACAVRLCGTTGGRQRPGGGQRWPADHAGPSQSAPLHPPTPSGEASAACALGALAYVAALAGLYTPVALTFAGRIRARKNGDFNGPLCMVDFDLERQQGCI